MPSFSVRLGTLILVPVLLMGLVAAACADTVDLDGMKRQVTGLQREQRNLDTAIKEQRSENERLANNLDAVVRDDAELTFQALRQAQFEVDIAQTRLLTLDHRLAEQADRMEQLNAQIIEASAELRSNQRDTLQRVVDEAALDWRGRIRGAAEEILQRLAVYRTLSQDYINLREEQLNMVQRSISLDALEGLTPTRDEPIVERLRALVDQLAQQALQLSSGASAIAETNPAAIARRNLLRLRSDEALLRSNTRLTDVTIVQSRSVLAGLEPMLTEPSIPVRLFDEATAAVDEIGRTLAQRAATTASNRSALTDLSRILAEPGEADGGVQSLRLRIEGLRELLADQEEEIAQLRQTVGSTFEALVREGAARRRATLLVRETARTDRAARLRIAEELRTLPAALSAIYEGRLAEVETALRVAQNRRFVGFGLAVLTLIGLTLYLRERLLKRFVNAEATRATEIPLEVVRRNLFWLFPAGVWWLFAAIFAISAETTMSVLTLLVIPAVAALLRDLTQVIVVRRSVGKQRRIGAFITRSTEIAVVLSCAFVFAYVVLNEVALLPSTQTAINRLAYSVFVLSGLPMLMFVFFFAASGEHGSYGRIRRSIAGLLSLLPPLALIATGVTGLAGYTRLAAVMLENLTIAIAIAALLALGLGILNDIVEGVTARMRASDPARAFFARANFLQPLARAAQLGLLAIAIMASVRVFEWTHETPVIREIVLLWNSTVFTAGGTPYSVGAVLFAALAFAFIFWVAGWSRRVAYTVVFGNLKDIGIRQSLSVFAQYVVIVVGVLLTLSVVGFDVTTLTVFAASLGVGIGFGLQNVVNNFISGLLLLVERPLRIGDIVTVGANSGTVMQIGIRSMRMKTFDEFDLIVPNSALIADTFTNWTRTNTVMRVLIAVGIGYDDDPDEAIHLVYEALEGHQGVLASPAPMVTVDEFGDNSINLRMCYYVDLRGGYSSFKTRSEVLTAVWRSFGEHGITIPFPQRDVRMIASKAPPKKAKVDARPRDADADDWVGDAVEMAGGADREAF